MNNIPVARAALGVNKRKVEAVLAVAKGIYAAMLAEAERFPAPDPTLVRLLAQIDALALAQQAIGTGGRAATAARDVARNTLWASLLGLRCYVQSVANVDPTNSVVIVTSAAFSLAGTPRRSKPLLDAKLTATPGAVLLIANARLLCGNSQHRPTFHWQYSVDGRTWVSAPSTPRATTTIASLPLLTHCSFRVSVTLGTTQEPWSQVVALTVI